MTAAYKTLIIGPAWVGDMVMSQSLYKLLKQNNPAIAIDVLAPGWTKPLLARMPEVKQILSMPLGHGELNFKIRYKLGKELQHNHYDQAIVLPNSFKSALVPFFAKIPKRTGWRGEMRYGLLNDVRVLDKQKYPLMIERFMALGLPKNATLPKPYPFPKLQIAKENIAALVQKFALPNLVMPILALCPGAKFGPSKRWPAEYFAAVAQYGLKQGWQVWLFGSEDEKVATNAIQQHTQNGCVDFAGGTSLAEAIDLLSLATIVVTNDSGLMHIAAALDRPLIAIYGSSSPNFTPPLSNKVKILTLGLECSPCFKRECPLGHWKCMRALKPELVIEAITACEY